MSGIRKVMAAIDLSDYSAETMKVAMEIAHASQAELIVVNVINQRDIEAMEKVAEQISHISTEEFVDSWDKGDDSFESNPPNAVLSIFHPDMVSDVVVELMNPQLDGHEMKYDVVILDGEMPADGGPNALFIDVIGRPATPVSAAGMHRRTRRRTRRRVRR